MCFRSAFCTGVSCLSTAEDPPSYLSNAAPNTFHVLLSSMPLGGIVTCAMDTMNGTGPLVVPYLLQMEFFFLKGVSMKLDTSW